MYADQIIYGRVYTCEEQNPVAEALAIRKGKFAYVGSKEGAAALTGPDTEVIRYDTGCILPSMADGHAHLTTTVTMAGVSFYGLKTVEEYLDAIRTYIKESPDKKAITGKGYISGVFDEKGPTAAMLDAICSDKLMVFSSEDCHSSWVNTAVLQAMGITKDTPDPSDGEIVRDPVTKEATGWLKEAAQDPTNDLLPPYTKEDYVQGILKYQDMALSQGITNVFEPLFLSIPDADTRIAAYEEVEKAGKLQLTVRLGYSIQSTDDTHALFEHAKALREQCKSLPHVHLDTIKLFMDGVIENHTACLLEPYSDSPAGAPDRGEVLWKQDVLNAMVLNCVQNGFHIHVHCIGDGAAELILNAFEYANSHCPGHGCRYAMTHLQVLTQEQIRRMAALKVTAVVNPYWHFKDPLYYPTLELPFLGPERAEKEYPLQDLFKAGLNVSQASDWPVTVPAEPFTSLQLMVNRKRQDYMDLPPLGPDQALSLSQALNALTIGGATEMDLQREKGSIAVDKDADYIMIDSDAFKQKPEELYGMKVLKTVAQGKTLWQVS